MDTGRVVIDTEDLRELVRFTGGAVDQLADIRLDLVRARSYLEQNPVAYNEYATVVAGVDALGSVLSQDRSALIAEVTAIEGEEGMAPVAPWIPPAQVDGPASDRAPFVLGAAVILGAALRHLDGLVQAGPTPPPGPWNTSWVTPGGTIPAGGEMSTRSDVHDEFGVQWSGSARTGSGPVSAGASGKASAGGWAHGEAEAGSTGSGYQASASASAGVRASVEGEVDAELGDLKLGASGGASAQAQASAEAHGSIGQDGVHAGASASASASAEVHGEVHASLPGAQAGVEGHAEAHADAHAEGSVDVGPDGVGGSVGAGASAGVSAGYSAAADGPGGTHAGIGGNVKAGIGVEVSGSAEIGWDKVGFSFDIGAALGIGAGFSLDLSFSPEELVDDIGGALEDLVTDPLGTVAGVGADLFDAAGGIIDTAGEVLGAIGDGAVAVGGAAVDVAGALDTALADLFGAGPDPSQLPPAAAVVLPDPPAVPGPDAWSAVLPDPPAMPGPDSWSAVHAPVGVDPGSQVGVGGSVVVPTESGAAGFFTWPPR